MRQVMKALVDSTGDLGCFIKNIETTIAHGAKSLFLLSADENNFALDSLNNFLQQIPVPVFGAIFPRIISENKIFTRGSIVCGFNAAPQIEHLFNLSQKKTDQTNHLAKFAETLKKLSTLVLFVDSTSKNIANFIEKTYQQIGGNRNYFGGGAGSLSFIPKPCLYSNQGLLQDAAQLVGFNEKILISIDHGWEIFAGPFVITESRNNIIRKIDYQPAFQVYKNAIEEKTSYRFKADNFFEIAKYNPFGIAMLDNNCVVRDPISTKDNNIICVADVPENSIVYILQGNSKKLIAAATRAATALNSAMQGKFTSDTSPIIAFDCVSRCLTLGNKINAELDAISTNLAPTKQQLIGAATIGEIANYGNQSLEFFNKTLVLGVFTEN